LQVVEVEVKPLAEVVAVEVFELAQSHLWEVQL
jgi:hypothetical protein